MISRVFLSFVFLLSGFVTLVLFEPQILINAKTLMLAQVFLRLPVSFRADDVRAESLSLEKKSLHFKLSHFCFSGEDHTLFSCAEHVELGLVIQLKGFSFFISEIDPVFIEGTFFKGDFSKPSAQKRAGPHFDWRRYFPPSFSDLKISNVYITMRSIKIKTSDEDLSGSLLLSKLGGQTDGRFVFKSKDIQAQLILSNKNRSDLINLRGFLFKDQSLKLKWSGGFDYTKWNYSLNAKATLADHTEVEGLLMGEVDHRKTVGSLKAQLLSKNFQLKTDRQNLCHYTLEFSGKREFQCDLDYALPKTQIEKILPSQIVVAVHALLNQTLDSGHISLNLIPIHTSALNLDAEVRAKLENFKLAPETQGVSIYEKVNLDVRSFKSLVKVFSKTPFQIPAPFNVLDGKLVLQSESEIKRNQDQIPLFFKSDLKGTNQIFLTQMLLKLEFLKLKEFYLKGDVILDDVQLVLPRLDLARPPAFVPDSRIQNKDKMSQTQAHPFKFNLNVRTGREPLRLISNLAESPIPIAGQFVVASDLPFTGTMNCGPVDILLFRHKATIQFFKANFKGVQAQENPVRGDVIVPFSDFIVHIDISGTEKNPIIKLQSDPPYSESEILAAVLFGKSPSSLDADQTSSVGNTQAAMADRALSLSSFYFLASTPVESVGYDSSGGGMITAKVRIKEGVSMDVGADTNSLRELGVNKSLGNSWYLHTYVTNPADATQNQSVTAFIEKLYKY